MRQFFLVPHQMIADGRQRLRKWNIRDLDSMVEPLAGVLERREHHEQFVLTLIGSHLTVGERPPVAMTIHPILNGRLDISAANEMGIHRMDGAITVDGPPGGHQCLRHQLTAERPRTYLFRVVSTERVFTDLLQIQQTEESTESVDAFAWVTQWSSSPIRWT